MNTGTDSTQNFWFVCGHGDRTAPLSDHRCVDCTTALARRKPTPVPIGDALRARIYAGYASIETQRAEIVAPHVTAAIEEAAAHTAARRTERGVE